MKFLSFVLGSMAVALAVLTPDLAAAANRTFCFNNIVIQDRRVECPANLVGNGARYSCAAGGTVDVAPNGFRIELWDKDPAGVGSDDKIGTWLGSTSTSGCMTFPWEGSAAADDPSDDADPDVYIKILATVRHSSGSGSMVHGQTKLGAGGDVSFRSVGNSNCTTAGGAACTETSTLRPGGAVDDDTRLRFQGLLSAKNVVQEMKDLMTQNVVLKGPMDCNSTSCNSYTISRGEVQLIGGHLKNGAIVGHEFGHVLQEQLFDQDTLRNDTSWISGNERIDSFGNPFPWDLCHNCWEWESCATTEGFAVYFSQAIWLNPNNTASVPTYAGFTFEDADPHDTTCQGPSDTPLAAAKSFWDADDANNEAAIAPATIADVSNMDTIDVVGNWDRFPAGTSNRQNYEADSNGVNMKDYVFSGWSGLFQLQMTMLHHNCLHLQDND